jgi:serine/threonine protein kinase
MSYCINPNCQHPQNPDNNIFCATCGSELLIQGNYRVIKSLGSGGFATTYEINSEEETKVLKVLTHNSQKAVELFQREAKVLENINHPGVPKVPQNGYFIFYPKNSQLPLHCLIMEKIEGVNLRQYIEGRNNRPINNDLALRWLKELLDILNVIHSKDLLHRDIKPSNIMIKPDGKLALIDFGAAKDLDGLSNETQTATSTENTKTATSIYSITYAPQEQIVGQALKQSDFFALGRTFIYLLTGKEPNDKAMYNALENKVNWRNFADSDITDSLAEVIDQMTEMAASNRPRNVEEILAKLDTTKQSYQPQINSVKPNNITSRPGNKPSSPQSSNQKSSKKTLTILGVIIGLFIAIPLFGSLFSNQTTTTDYSTSEPNNNSSNSGSPSPSFNQPTETQKNIPTPTLIPETNPSPISTQSINKLTSLENYLQQENWKEADLETLSLIFQSQSINNFPCSEIREIDQLWLKYSGGKFGLSVQKPIYFETGNTPGINNQEAWRRFADRVGWRVNGIWLESYNDLNLSLNAPQGHLPAFTGQKGSVNRAIIDRGISCGL